MDTPSSSDNSNSSPSGADNSSSVNSQPQETSDTAKSQEEIAEAVNQPNVIPSSPPNPSVGNMQGPQIPINESHPAENTSAAEVSTTFHPPVSHKPNMVILSLVVLSIGILAGLGLFASGLFRRNTLRMGESISNQPTKAAVQRIEKITVGTDATYPPMEFKDENGKLVGYDIDLAGEIGKEMKVAVEFKDIAFDKIFEALEANEIDAIMSSVTITEERKIKYNFSEPYINAGQVMVALRSDQQTRWTTDNLAGKRVGVQKGTTSEEEALKYVSKNLVTAFADYSLAISALNNKGIDVIIVDLTAAKGLVDKNPNLQIISDPFTNEYYGVVFRKTDRKLKSEVDKSIMSLQKRGILNNIKQKWFQ